MTLKRKIQSIIGTIYFNMHKNFMLRLYYFLTCIYTFFPSICGPFLQNVNAIFILFLFLIMVMEHLVKRRILILQIVVSNKVLQNWCSIVYGSYQNNWFRTRYFSIYTVYSVFWQVLQKKIVCKKCINMNKAKII